MASLERFIDQTQTVNFLTISPEKVDSIAPDIGTLVNFQFCLPSGWFTDGFLRIRGHKFIEDSIHGGVIHIFGINSADQNIDFSRLEFITRNISKNEAEIIFGGMLVVSPPNSTICNQVTIAGVLIAPSIDRLVPPVASTFEIEAGIGGTVKTTLILPFIIDSYLHPSKPNILLEDLNDMKNLLAGATNYIFLGVRPVRQGDYQLFIDVVDPDLVVEGCDALAPNGLNFSWEKYTHGNNLTLFIVEKYYPNENYVHPNSIQVIRIIVGLPVGNDLTATVKISSYGFFEKVYPTLVKLLSSSGVTIKSDSEPKMTLGYHKVIITQAGMSLQSGTGQLEWLLYLTFPKDSSTLQFTLNANNDDVLPVAPPSVSTVVQSVSCDNLNQNVINCNYQFGPFGGFVENLRVSCSLSGSNPLVIHPSVRKYSNLALPNVFTADNTCDHSVWQIGDIFATKDANSLNLTNVPYDMSLKILHVDTGKPVTRPLHCGEVALVLFEFKQAAKSFATYVPTIRFASEYFGLTLDCPFIEAIGGSIHWNKNVNGCINSTALEYPISQINYRIGPTICVDNKDNKIALGAYLRARTTPYPSGSSAEIVGTAGGIEEVMLQNLGQTRVSLSSSQMHNIKYQFCMKPGVYIDNLYFQAYSETTLGYEEVITVAYLQFNKSFNFPGLQLPQAQVLVDVRKPTGQRYSMRTYAGPVYNSGM
ncbi:hypothetical protein ACTXT7_008839 [Hymenolepis weldensis]